MELASRLAIDLEEREITIQAPWGQLAALTWGASTSSPVLLVHGMLDVCSGFRPLVSRLPRSFFYVSLDLPGNGKSDPFPAKSRYTITDYVAAVSAVKDNFKWDRFIFIGHSIGALVGKYYDLVYPGTIKRMVELDPLPAYEDWLPEDFAYWYNVFYGDFYQEEKYKKYTADLGTAPKHTYEKALDIIMNRRGLTQEASEHILERALVPTGDGLYRFTHDQRQKQIPRLPFNAEVLKKLYTSTRTPIFCVMSKNDFVYRDTPFVKDEGAWPNKNYKIKIVNAVGHDEHINNPDIMAEDISKFLLEDFKAKL